MILGGDITSALRTGAGLGLALILEGDGAQRVRLGWTDEAEPRMVVSAEGYDDDAIAAAVHRHAQATAAPGNWIQADLEGEPWNGTSAVFSPRVKAAGTVEQWRELQRLRHDGIDRVARQESAADLIGALGEPAYWRFADKEMKKPRPDDGANRWEMKTRNRGEDFVANRLRSLAQIVSARTVERVATGLCGQTLIDEAYRQCSRLVRPVGDRLLPGHPSLAPDVGDRRRSPGGQVHSGVLGPPDDRGRSLFGAVAGAARLPTTRHGEGSPGEGPARMAALPRRPGSGGIPTACQR